MNFPTNSLSAVPHRRMRLRGMRNAGVISAALVAVAAVAVLSSCFSERQTATGPTATIGECRIPTSSTAAGTVVIFIRNFTFIPEQVSLKRGTKVTWVNCEDAGSESHTSTSDTGLWDSPRLAPTDVYSRTFNDATGTIFNYHCVPHPFMKGTVTVE